MLEKVIFDLIAVALFIVILFKVIGKNDSNYILILVLEAIGIFISFIEIKLGIDANTFFMIIRYLFSIIIPVVIILIEAKGINFSELLSVAYVSLLLTFNNTKLAKKVLIKLVTKYPDSYLGHKMLAMLYEKEGGMRKAIDEYVKAVDIKKDDDKSYFKIANLLNELGQKKEAIQMLETLVKTKPDSYDGSVLLGNLLCEEQRFKEAEKVYQDALRFKPDSFELYYSLGIVYTMLNEFNMAKEAYEMAAEINHKSLEANYNLGQIALIFGELDTAEMYFKKCLYEELEPDSYYQLAKIYVLKGDSSSAIDFLNKAIEINPDLLEKANKEKMFEKIKHLITVSVKMDEEIKEEEYEDKEEKIQEEKDSFLHRIEINAREYLESTNGLINDINENTEKQIISERVDKIFKEKLLQDEKELLEQQQKENEVYMEKEITEPKIEEKEQRQKELGSD